MKNKLHLMKAVASKMTQKDMRQCLLTFQCVDASWLWQHVGYFASVTNTRYETLDSHTWLRAAAGAGGRSLKQDTVGFLFCLLLFHWRFPIYLSDQVIEDLRRHNKGKTTCNRRETMYPLLHEAGFDTLWQPEAISGSNITNWIDETVYTQRV